MNRFFVTELHIEDEYIELRISEPVDKTVAEQLQDGERMLVDSDQLAFVYILEDAEQFYYLVFVEAIWQGLAKIYNEDKRVQVVFNDEKTIVLTAIHNELEFLLENIQGNGNYGERLEEAVLAHFS
ncbi:hypothetical protein [Alkalihalobacillus pseudalcaliphilus]|uniref:UPF0738 family protein n=1 Tax=Alkalihalobacillus pseudalcaliphilus TaxID=79884 RepID=UPI00064DE930|nr:hypothetical protein [Alkalihalobacillus pseudalcaliphilus]KMK77305.1 hypothetical protein AB990_07090 [Alkalihalobacillus pseudalcaliphilus]